MAERLVQLLRAERRAAAESAGGADARLRTIPGVGLRTAEAVVAFIGDPQRFPNAKAVGRTFGLVPSQDQPGDRNRLGHITREGAPVVRRLVAEAAWQALRRSPTVRAYFERVQREDPQHKKIALVAAAHYLVRVVWALLKRGTVWQKKPGLAKELSSDPCSAPGAKPGEGGLGETGHRGGTLAYGCPGTVAASGTRRWAWPR